MKKPPILWINFIFLTVTPILALIFVPYYGLTVGYDWFEWSMFFLFMAMTGLSITGGYHRLWSHKTYKAQIVLRIFYAVWGAASVQNSIAHWASDHRRHHRFVDDNEKDPYSAKRGFLFSHIGWIIRKYPSAVEDFSNIKDLMRDPVVRLQHKFYVPLAVLTNVGIPLLIGYFHGKLWGTLMLAGLLRLVLNHHFTFFINSIAHMWGTQTFSDKDTSRDSFWLALVTYGEGFHNFHHRFQHDYRNGVRWWHFDPAKWLIRTCSLVNITRDLKRTNKFQIERARLQMQMKRALAKLERKGIEEDWRERLEKSFNHMIESLEAWTKAKQAHINAKRNELAEKMDSAGLKRRYRELRAEFKMRRREWTMLHGNLAAAV